MLKSSRTSTDIIEKFGDWEVLKDGSIYKSDDKSDDKSNNHWHITPDRLSEKDLWIHLNTLDDFDFNPFMKAFFCAMEVAKISELRIKTTYDYE